MSVAPVPTVNCEFDCPDIVEPDAADPAPFADTVKPNVLPISACANAAVAASLVSNCTLYC